MTHSTLNSSSTKTIKFLYSYGGKLIPRPTDGILRYVGGNTRVLSVDRSVTFSELMVKFGELCEASVNLKCNLPNEDLDVLISVKTDEDLKNVIEEYERASPDSKIMAVLINSAKKTSSPPSPVSCLDFVNSSSAACYREAPPYTKAKYRCYPLAESRCCCSHLPGYPCATRKYPHYERSPMHYCHLPHRNHFH